jgi:hypothetical protein
VSIRTNTSRIQTGRSGERPKGNNPTHPPLMISSDIKPELEEEEEDPEPEQDTQSLRTSSWRRPGPWVPSLKLQQAVGNEWRHNPSTPQ